mgnify:CR=1 FL=1
MKRRSGIQIMGKLIGLIRPLMHVMAAAILLGVTGYLCAYLSHRYWQELESCRLWEYGREFL